MSLNLEYLGITNPKAVYRNLPVSTLTEKAIIRGEGTLSLTEAVHKVTGQPAERFRLAGKGVIAPGADADLCLFDAANIRERDSYEHPDSLAAGMDYVFVRGVLAIAEGEFTGMANGRAIIA